MELNASITSLTLLYVFSGIVWRASATRILFSFVRSKSFHPWCCIKACFVVGNCASSFSTSSNEARPVCFVICGNLPVSLYILSLAASLYILTKWKLKIIFWKVALVAFLSISTSSSWLVDVVLSLAKQP